MASKKRTVGQPTKFEPRYCDMLVSHMQKGFSFFAFAGNIGVCRATLYHWLKLFPEFKEAKALGTARSLFWWESQLIDGIWNTTTKDINGETSTVRLNTAAWIFAVKNRFPKEFSDKYELKTEKKDNPKTEKNVERLVAWIDQLKSVD